MGKTYDQLDARLRRWIADQRMFFVATAPSGRGGHINLSPKGHADTLAILDGRTVAYLDLTGSGAETIHWVEGEDPAAAPTMRAGDYLLMPAGLNHVSAATADQDCLELITQDGKFDFTLASAPSG